MQELSAEKFHAALPERLCEAHYQRAVNDSRALVVGVRLRPEAKAMATRPGGRFRRSTCRRRQRSSAAESDPSAMYLITRRSFANNKSPLHFKGRTRFLAP
jgi:hypothetical protein